MLTRMYTAVRLILIFEITLLYVSLIFARRGQIKAGKEKCIPVSEKGSVIDLLCTPSDLIYALDIKTYNSTECNDNACAGLQPKVLTDSLLCYSRQNCTIAFNNRAPIVKTRNASCIGTTPSRLRIRHQCISKSLLHALYKNGEPRWSEDVTLDQGMLVSHANYPWHYAAGISVNMTLSPKTEDRTKLYISVPVFDLDSNDEVKLTNHTSDGLQFENIKGTTGTSELFLPSSESKVTIVFNTDLGSSTAKGFFICFCWSKADEDLSKIDICSKVQGKRRRKRRRGKGAKKKRKNRKKKTDKRKSKSQYKRKKKHRKNRKGKKRNKRN